MEIERETDTQKHNGSDATAIFQKQNSLQRQNKTKQNKRESENGNEMKNEETFGAGMEHAKFYSKVNSEKKKREMKNTHAKHTQHT